MRILIVKTSALGDILQTFPTLEFLKKFFIQAQDLLSISFNADKLEIHFAVLEENQDLVLAHPLIDKVLTFPRKKFWQALFSLKKEKYDLVLDLQGNTRSGLIMLFTKSQYKVGYGKKSVAEWPNLLCSNLRYEVDKTQNIRLQYFSLLEHFLQSHFALSQAILESPIQLFSKRFLQLAHQTEKDKKIEIVNKVKALQKKYDKKLVFLVAPFSKWPSKTIGFELLLSFLKRIEQEFEILFLFLQGSDTERAKSLKLASYFSTSPEELVLEKLSMPLLQRVMQEMDLLIGMDSCPLHLAILAGVPTVSFFGPTLAEVYGAKTNPKHLSFEGSCLLQKFSFEKRCPLLRDCSLKCIDSHNLDDLFTSFTAFCQKIELQQSKPKAVTLN